MVFIEVTIKIDWNLDTLKLAKQVHKWYGMAKGMEITSATFELRLRAPGFRDELRNNFHSLSSPLHNLSKAQRDHPVKRPLEWTIFAWPLTENTWNANYKNSNVWWKKKCPREKCGNFSGGVAPPPLSRPLQIVAPPTHIPDGWNWSMRSQLA